MTRKFLSLPLGWEIAPCDYLDGYKLKAPDGNSILVQKPQNDHDVSHNAFLWRLINDLQKREMK